MSAALGVRAAPRARSFGVRREALERHGLAALFLSPAVLLFTLFVVMPVVEAAWFSFYRWNGYGTPHNFVGLRNYYVLMRNGVFSTALVNTAYVVAVSLLIQLPLALGVALMTARSFRFVSVFRTIFFLPYILGEVVAGLIWRFVFDDNFGLVHAISAWLHVDPPYILANADLAIYAVLVVVVWKYFGFHMMIYIAGLQDIPREMTEAAAIDGATKLQQLRYVTIPMLAPSIRLSVFFAVVGALQLFDIVMPLTGGGPANATHTLVTFQYVFGITRMDIGFGSAVGVVLFVLCVGFTLGFRRLLMRSA